MNRVCRMRQRQPIIMGVDNGCCPTFYVSTLTGSNITSHKTNSITAVTCIVPVHPTFSAISVRDHDTSRAGYKSARNMAHRLPSHPPQSYDKKTVTYREPKGRKYRRESAVAEKRERRARVPHVQQICDPPPRTMTMRTECPNEHPPPPV